MKLKSSNYLLAEGPVFKQSEVKPFEILDPEHSSLLYQALFLNALEVLSAFTSSPLIIILDNKDQEYLPGIITGKKNKFIFANLEEKEKLFRSLDDKYFHEYENNIIFLSNSIGYSHSDILKVQNLLSLNDDCLVIARSANQKIAFAGFNTYPEFMEGTNLDYENILLQSCRYNSLLYTIGNFIHLDSRIDFKLLYEELSKKESLSYCSQAMHELFTHLFIEYKDLLK